MLTLPPAIRLAVVAATLLASPSGGAQTRPDFSGQWVMDEARSVSARYPDFAGPVIVVITQSDAEVTIETSQGTATTTGRYRVYDSQAAAAATPPTAPLFRSYWQGDDLVTESIRNVNDSTVRTKEVRSLSPDGLRMFVDATVVVEHGYTLAGAQNYGNGRDVFNKRVR